MPPRPADMPPALSDLLDLMDLEYIEENIFRGGNRNLGSRRVFGGQVLAQALVAARRTVDEDREAHSVHAYFILPGDIGAPIVYDVDRIRDGGSFTTRRIRAIQHGRPIFNLSMSFHRPEEGHEHQDPMPTGYPGPDELPDELDLLRQEADRFPEAIRPIVLQDRPFHFRPIDPVTLFDPEPRPARRAAWFKTTAPLPDDLATHQALLAYASDHGFLPTALRPHGLSWVQRDMQVASLDHTLWFHRPFRVDEWLLYVDESPSAYGARGFIRGAIYQADGTLVASAAQEGLMRQRKG
jgi:acyl-CoA thioesterase II